MTWVGDASFELLVMNGNRERERKPGSQNDKKEQRPRSKLML
jgi:hypothetical protein